MPEFIKVADLFLVKEGDEYTGLEMPMTDNVLNKTGAANLLDFTKRCLDDSSWVVNTVMRVKDAPTKQSGDTNSDTGGQGIEGDQEAAETQGVAGSGANEQGDDQ